MEQPVERLMKTTMESIKNMIDVNTIVGDPVQMKDGSVIVPISRVSFAFVAGGGEFANKQCNEDNEQQNQKMPFAGGSGAGVSVHPIGFISSSGGQLKMLPISYNTSVDRVIDTFPTIIDNIEGFIQRRAEKKQECCSNEVSQES